MTAPRWSPTAGAASTRRRLRILVVINVLLSVWYFHWLLAPRRVGNPVLYGLLVLAEVFNVVQASGFWWTSLKANASDPARARGVGPTAQVDIDVLIPTYGEPVELVERTVRAARRMRGARLNVVLCDDADRPEMAAMARRAGVAYQRRDRHVGAKAGNLNNALEHTDAPYVVVLDCDHVPAPNFVEATLGALTDPCVAFVQTPQYYANAGENPVAASSWSQQALFFGIIARGKGEMGAMFCCGTNVVFRRQALAEVGGFPEDTVTEDFELSIRLQEAGWTSVYLPEVLAEGLGPEDMASYVSQQHRWARGCLAGAATVVRSRLPARVRIQYLLSSMFFLTGWTYIVYMMLPVANIVDLGGAQPLARATSDQFLIHFGPYFAANLATVAVAGAGSYTFAAFCLTEASFWIHVHATFLAVTRRKSRFVVTPKHGAAGPQPKAMAPALVALAVLCSVAAWGLWDSRSPAMLNNVAFALLHIVVLSVGVWPAVFGSRARTGRSDDELEPVARAA